MYSTIRGAGIPCRGVACLAWPPRGRVACGTEASVFWQQRTGQGRCGAAWGAPQSPNVPLARTTRTRSYKQAMGALWSGPQLGAGTLSPLDDKHKNSANQTPPSPSPASKVSGWSPLPPLPFPCCVLTPLVSSQVVRPLKNFLQAVQRNQLLASAGPTERGGGIKSFIRRNTPTRPAVKVRWSHPPLRGWRKGSLWGVAGGLFAQKSIQTVLDL